MFPDNLGTGRDLKIPQGKSQGKCLPHFFLSEQQPPFQTRGTHPILRHTPARGIAGLTHHFGEALEALQHVQAQSQEPEQHQVRAKISKFLFSRVQK